VDHLKDEFPSVFRRSFKDFKIPKGIVKHGIGDVRGMLNKIIVNFLKVRICIQSLSVFDDYKYFGYPFVHSDKCMKENTNKSTNICSATLIID